MKVAGSPVSRRLLSSQYPGAVGNTQGSTVLVDERIIRPLRDFVTDPVDVLDRPVWPPLGRANNPGDEVRGPGEGLHWLVAIAVWRCVRCQQCFAGAVETRPRRR